MKKIIKNNKLLLLLGVSLLISACSTAEGSVWDKTRTLYYTYINTAEVMKYDDRIELEEAEHILASNIVRIGEQLTAFEQALEVMSMPPTSESLQAFFNRVPWVSGIVLINNLGNMTGALPEDVSAKLDLAALLKVPENQHKREVRAVVQEDYNGSKILVGRPVFDEYGSNIGVFIVYFDMRALFNYVEMDPSIFVLAGNTPLWTGDFLLNETPLAGTDFIEETSSSSNGNLSNSHGKALWVNRYLYNQPIIFAIMQH